MYIFLDFDGVLRRNTSHPSRFEADCLANFEEVVRTIDEARIVISSTWREGYMLDEIKRMFSADIAKKIIGKTPIYMEYRQHNRYSEVLAWLRNNAKGDEKWVVIDDMQTNFPDYCYQIITDPERGFTKEDGEKLRLYFEGEGEGEGPQGKEAAALNSIRTAISMAKERFCLEINGIHGLGHWERVRENGLRLSRMTGADAVVVEHFSYLHDCCRTNDGLDPEHGKRAAELVRSIRNKLNLNDHQFSLLHEACRDHSLGRTEADITVMTCWDADRLDLKRVHIQPLSENLCTSEAKCQELISWASQRAEAWKDSP